MFEHLISGQFEYEPPVQTVDASPTVLVEEAAPAAILDAQVKTAALKVLFDDEESDAVITEAQQRAAREAFGALVVPSEDLDVPDVRAKLTRIQVPEAVQHLVGMLTAYDWEYVKQAKEMRSYVVAKLMEETVHPDAKIRLKALQMLGKVTEVGVFTERVEVTQKPADEAELEDRLRERLRGLLPVSGGVTDVVAKQDGADA